MLVNKTASGKTALFNIPPTVVRRDSFCERVAYGRGSISDLMNTSVVIMYRELGSPGVTTTAGKLIAFEARNNDKHIIFMEDVFPKDPDPIAPLLTINLPDLKASRISCDKPFAIINTGAEATRFRLQLAEHECATINLR